MAEEEKKERKIEQEIQTELEIDETKLAEELQRQPSRFFYWAVSWALAQRKSRITKLKLERLEAQVSAAYRKDMVAQGLKPRDVTIKMVDDFCTEHSDVKVAREAVIQDEYLTDMLEVAKVAFRQRADALRELFKNSGEQEYLQEHSMNAMNAEIDRKRGRKQPKENEK